MSMLVELPSWDCCRAQPSCGSLVPQTRGPHTMAIANVWSRRVGIAAAIRKCMLCIYIDPIDIFYSAMFPQLLMHLFTQTPNWQQVMSSGSEELELSGTELALHQLFVAWLNLKIPTDASTRLASPDTKSDSLWKSSRIQWQEKKTTLSLATNEVTNALQMANFHCLSDARPRSEAADEPAGKRPDRLSCPHVPLPLSCWCKHWSIGARCKAISQKPRPQGSWCACGDVSNALNLHLGMPLGRPSDLLLLKRTSHSSTFLSKPKKLSLSVFKRYQKLEAGGVLWYTFYNVSKVATWK